MYQQIYKAFRCLSSGHQAELRRANLKRICDLPAYFHLLKLAHVPDNLQTQRIVYLLVGIKIVEEGGDGDEGYSVAEALLLAGVKEAQIIQLTRAGDNSLDYLKRQLVRCKNIDLNSLGKLAQFWGDKARRDLLKEFILADQPTETN